MKMPIKQTSTPAPKLLDQVRGKIRLKHYSVRTEQAYVDWIKRFILFHGKPIHTFKLNPSSRNFLLLP